MRMTSPNTEARVVLHEVSFPTFFALSRESTGGRIAYDRGTLEIISLSFLRENTKGNLGRMVEVYTLEKELPLLSAGSTTFGREDLERGLEPDASYYIQSASRVIGNTEIELPHDPPPDLVIEVEITRSSINKLDICRALGIREVWRYNGKRLEVNVLRDDGQYEPRPQSSVLPGFPLDYALELLEQRDSLDSNAIARQFEAYVRQGGSEA